MHLPDNDPQSGDVYYYPYRWHRQHPGAEAEKDRPCCVAIRLKAPFRGRSIFVLALSTTGVPVGGFGVIVPEEEMRRLRRLGPGPCWLTTSECNLTDPASPAFTRSEYLGTFSEQFMRGVVLPQLEGAIRQETTRVRRD